MIQSAMGQGMLFTIRLPRDDRRVRFLPSITPDTNNEKAGGKTNMELRNSERNNVQGSE
jgi:hypothetical protein